jgi:glycopeptide antibiotics resistance protein
MFKTLKKLGLALIAGLTIATTSAMAALPASVATTVTAIQTDGQDIFDLVFPVVGAFVGLVLVIKLFKRFSNKI